jgi:FlaA1/EpsC-like NDP-sugar epimerase
VGLTSAFLPAAAAASSLADTSAGASASCQASMSAATPASCLEHKKVLVTGGGRGIGRAIALACAEEGARVAILARTREELDAVAAEAQERLKAQISVVVADVTKEDEVAAAVSEAGEE